MEKTPSQYAVSRDGAPVAYRVYGEGEPTVVVCNGIGCNQAFVDPLIQDLARRYRTVIWDYRGHVDSPVPRDPRRVTMDACIEDLEAVMAALPGEQAVLAGFSMGVQIILEYYGRHPEQVLGLVPMLGACEHPLRTFFYLGRLFEGVVPAALGAVRRRPKLLQRVWSGVLSGPWMFPVAKATAIHRRAASREIFDSWCAHLAGIDVETFLQLGVYLGQHSAKHVLERVTVPCLVVAGERDNFTPLRVLRRLHAQIPGAQWFSVKEGTHGALFEFPEEINPRVHNFLAEHFGKTWSPGAHLQRAV